MKAWAYDAAIWEDEIYCIECLPARASEEDAVPIFAGSEVESYPICIRCKYEHTYMSKLEKENGN